ncbi:hypothetical protein [Pseudoalteromonas sp. NBT06-2]|uniref:hypothetical protein n=1 Tax=Pseudoalteromonas sp. NBT06-2 TaxID=2025950 RepID=UPI002075619A|nr:hypothetical protein [Pseudoalteromonas sp. NBT06-2]
MLVVPSFFKGVTINAKMRLDHELLSSPEPHILKWLGYMYMNMLKQQTLKLIKYLRFYSNVYCHLELITMRI